MSLEDYKKLARKLACLDRLAFLNGLDNEALQKGSMLDLQHQTIFRILGEIDNASLRAVINDYVAFPARREGFLDQTKRHMEILSESAEYAGSKVDPSKTVGGCSYKSQHDAINDDFLNNLRAAMEAEDPDGILFSNPLGFAYFPSESIKDDNLLNTKVVTQSDFASVGGMMYYGFNPIAGQASCLQGNSIHALAETFSAIIRNASGISNTDLFPQNHVTDELLAYAHGTEDWENRIESDLSAFLIAHENGHNPAHPENQALFRMLDDAGIDRNNFYNIDFPSSEDLRSWERIRSGRGSPRDVLFLFGDFLANMAVVKDSINHPSHKLLQAFNWWLVKAPTEKSRPRGLATFLAHSYNYRPEDHRNNLIEIFHAAVNAPHMLEGVLRKFENQGWEAVQDISKNISHNRLAHS